MLLKSSRAHAAVINITMMQPPPAGNLWLGIYWFCVTGICRGIPDWKPIMYGFCGAPNPKEIHIHTYKYNALYTLQFAALSIHNKKLRAPDFVMPDTWPDSADVAWPPNIVRPMMPLDSGATWSGSGWSLDPTPTSWPRMRERRQQERGTQGPLEKRCWQPLSFPSIILLLPLPLRASTQSRTKATGVHAKAFRGLGAHLYMYMAHCLGPSLFHSLHSSVDISCC